MQKGVEKVYVKNRDSRATPISTLFLVFPLFKYIYIFTIFRASTVEFE